MTILFHYSQFMIIIYARHLEVFFIFFTFVPRINTNQHGIKNS